MRSVKTLFEILLAGYLIFSVPMSFVMVISMEYKRDPCVTRAYYLWPVGTYCFLKEDR